MCASDSLIGNGSNGKSVLLFVLEVLLGAENVAGVQPSKFHSAFQRAHLERKLANIITEMSADEAIADAELKSITSGELITAEHKYGNPFEMRSYATCWFGTNHMPHSRDFSYALFRRALILTFNRRFTLGENADPELKCKLIKELPGILAMVLKAYGNVIQSGSLTEPKSSIEAKHLWLLNANQVAQFIEDCCEITREAETPSSSLYASYKPWAHKNGIYRPLSQSGFTRELEGLGYKRRRTCVARNFIGLKLNSAGPSKV